nr:hypothetical protein [Campylobacter hyointestinalis]
MFATTFVSSSALGPIAATDKNGSKLLLASRSLQKYSLNCPISGQGVVFGS